MSRKTTAVQAFKEVPGHPEYAYMTIQFESDRVGSINTKLTLIDIQNAIEEVNHYIEHSLLLKTNLLTSSYLQVVFSTADPEQLYYALNMLVDRGIINYNPATINGLLFGTESCHNWTDFGGRIYAGATQRGWSLSKFEGGYLHYQAYSF